MDVKYVENKPETAERAMTFTPEGGRLKRPNIWGGEGGGWRVEGGYYNGWNSADSRESAVHALKSPNLCLSSYAKSFDHADELKYAFLR